MVDTFGADPLRTSTFSDDIWVELHGGPTQPQIELGTGQTALTTLQRATAAVATGHRAR
ncbi:MAG: hypothetical protein WBM50_25225 [Acidimicrobiales bacterium]